MRFASSSLLILMVALLSSAPAHAQELSVSIDSGCADASIAEEVTAALGRPLAEGAPVLEARVAMRARGARVRVVIGLVRDGARSERVLVADDCAAAVRATALVLALALDADLGMEAEPAEVVAEVGTPTELEVVDADEIVAGSMVMTIDAPVDTPSIEVPAAARAPDVLVTLAVSGLVDAGSLPGANGGVRVGVGLGLGGDSFLRIELDGTYLASARQRSAAPGASVDLMLAYASLRIGVLFPIAGPLSLGAALDLAMGGAGGTGVGARVQDDTTVWLPWVATRLSASVELALWGPLSLRVSAAIGAPVVSPVFVVVGVEGVRPSSEILGEGAATVVLRLT